MQVSNQGQADIAVRLEAGDPEQGCWYAIDSPNLTVPAGQEVSTRLRIRPKEALGGPDSRMYLFTVTARPSPGGASRAVQGEWEQTFATV